MAFCDKCDLSQGDGTVLYKNRLVFGGIVGIPQPNSRTTATITELSKLAPNRVLLHPYNASSGRK
jgi:hypothetical protein